ARSDRLERPCYRLSGPSRGQLTLMTPIPARPTRSLVRRLAAWTSYPPPSIVTVNGSPATNVTGSGDGFYVFSGYAQPPLGAFKIDVAPGMVMDAQGRSLDAHSWCFELLDDAIDHDNDGLFSGDEVRIYQTNPLVQDTDHDCAADGYEVANGTDPLDRTDVVSLGTNYCMANPNSTGLTGVMTAYGSTATSANFMKLVATSIPSGAFGFFLAGQTQGFAGNAGGSQGNLCLAGAIGRFVGPGQIVNSGTAGRFEIDVDLTAIPTPTGLVTVLPGETWNFQAWHRDSNPAPTSNFTDATSVTFTQ
ncbi:MAG: hypothetical protein AAGK22_27310, partial [Acidobacteriota bacterium]